MRLRTTATALRLGTRAEGALHGARSYRCAKVVDEKSMRDHVACAKTRTRDVWVVCSLSESFFLRFDEPILGTIGNRHILDVGRPTFFFSCGLYSSLERSSVPPLSGRFSLVRAREGGL